MAGIGPYGIEQVDVPGILGNAQNMQFNRVRMMMAQKQLEMLERTTNIQTGTMQALQAYAKSLGGGDSGGAYGTSAGSSTGSSASGASSGSSGSASGGSGAASGAGSSTSAPAAPVTSMPHASDVVQPPSGGDLSSGAATTFAAPSGYRPPNTGDRAALFNNLLALNPEMASQVADGFKKMDDSQLQQVTYRNTRMAQMASGLLQLPQNERAAALQQHYPELQQLGVNPQQFQNFQPTDANLRQIVAEGMDIQRIAEFSKPDITQTPQGSTQRVINPDQTSSTIFESPTVVGPENQVFLRPSSMSTMLPTVQTPQDAAKLPPGTRFKLPDGRIGTVPGGAGGNASGGFQ